MRFTRTGDANLDGIVNNDDVTIVGANFAPGFAKPRWDLGDFDYNGFVDNDDVTLLGVFYNPGGPMVPTWSLNSNGNWSVATNWSNGVPGGVGATAMFLAQLRPRVP